MLNMIGGVENCYKSIEKVAFQFARNILDFHEDLNFIFDDRKHQSIFNQIASSNPYYNPKSSIIDDLVGLAIPFYDMYQKKQKNQAIHNAKLDAELSPTAAAKYLETILPVPSPDTQ